MDTIPNIQQSDLKITMPYGPLIPYPGKVPLEMLNQISYDFILNAIFELDRGKTLESTTPKTIEFKVTSSEARRDYMQCKFPEQLIHIYDLMNLSATIVYVTVQQYELKKIQVKGIK